jgi:hypothetical protein
LKENNQSKTDEKRKEDLTIFRPEGEILQKLCLCDLLSEISEDMEEEDKTLSDKNKKGGFNSSHPRDRQK